MTQPPDEMFEEAVTLTVVKDKILRIGNAASHCYFDKNIHESRARLLDIIQIASEALTICGK